MPDRPASFTALGVAVFRAWHQLHDASPKILNDAVIADLLGGEAIARAEAQRAELDTSHMRALRCHVVLRSRYAEDCLAEAAARGVRQYVSLGAGFDTFAFRQPSWASQLKIFEVDHPASQDAKRDRLAKAAIPIPSNLEFVPADFETSSLREILARSSFDFKAPAFFSCLGVLVYLGQEAIDALFALVGALPKGSEFVFTFSPKESSDDPETTKRFADIVAAIGEPFRSHHDQDELRTSLAGHGFSSVHFLSPYESEKLYFRGRRDLLPPRRCAIARAAV